MPAPNAVSRRKFLASTSAMLATGELGWGRVEWEVELAIHGGNKACNRAFPKPVRWGARELQQRGEAVKQPSLYYWKNKQRALLIELSCRKGGSHFMCLVPRPLRPQLMLFKYPVLA